jgi:diadenosine hexaphosphate hydrolase (ATP-forming)
LRLESYGLRIEQAGGIAVRRQDNQWSVLLVRSKKDPSVWIFPKGHIEPGESAIDAARRETLEEAGVDGDLIGPVGEPQEFQSGREPVRVRYFLIRATAESDSPEGRPKAWYRLDEAAAQLPFEGARRLLEETRRILASLIPTERR